MTDRRSEFIAVRGQNQKQTKKKKNNLTCWRDQNIEARSEHPTGNGVQTKTHSTSNADVQQQCRDAGGQWIRKGADGTQLKRRLNKDVVLRSGRLQRANVYACQECSLTTRFPSSVVSVRQSTGTKTEYKRAIDSRNDKYKGFSVAKNIKGVHAQQVEPKRIRNRKYHHKCKATTCRHKCVSLRGGSSKSFRTVFGYVQSNHRWYKGRSLREHLEAWEFLKKCKAEKITGVTVFPTFLKFVVLRYILRRLVDVLVRPEKYEGSTLCSLRSCTTPPSL